MQTLGDRDRYRPRFSVTGSRDDRAMPTDTAPAALPARRVVPLSPELRQHRRSVAQAALATGRPLGLDSITVILAVKQFETSTSTTPFTRWTTRQLVAFLWGSVTEWCAANGVVVPSDVGESLWTYLTVLFEQNMVASGSSSLRELRDVLVEQAGVTRSGRSRHPPGRRPSAAIHQLRQPSKVRPLSR